ETASYVNVEDITQPQNKLDAWKKPQEKSTRRLAKYTNYNFF
ncbi:unnamed protein product, partial [marine sediment metagenome]